MSLPKEIQSAAEAAAEAYLENDCYAMDGSGPHRDSFSAGVTWLYAHLSAQAGELPAHGEWSLDDIRAHMSPIHVMWSDRAIAKLVDAYAQMQAQVAALRGEREGDAKALSEALWRERNALAEITRLRAELAEAKAMYIGLVARSANE